MLYVCITFAKYLYTAHMVKIVYVQYYYKYNNSQTLKMSYY